ncbi:hypothetical protein [Streptomyces sp. MMG1121]|uniref:hypothetical protein n=1 Tax=Streptomyces sp. MMG1121 TaxID=1415544 RepID=UPI0006B0309D|nr:hypothetical protein [Streptomyces sp. MMG1121]
MIQFSLTDITSLPEIDALGRPCYGWRDGMAPEITYALNRGCWELGEEADRHTIALFASTGDGIVRLAVEVDRVEDAGHAPSGRRTRAIVGRVLEAGHPIHDRYVGEKAPEQLTVTFRYVTAECRHLESRTGNACTSGAKWIVTPDGDQPEYVACGQHVTAPIGDDMAFHVRPMK